MSKSIATTTGDLQDVVDAQIRAMFDRSAEEQSDELYYKDLGLFDYEPDVPEEKMNDISGPDKGVLTIEANKYGKTGKTRGYDITVTLRKYTFDLEWTEEDIHWLNKQSSSKRVSTLRNFAVGAVNSLQQNINEDTCKVFYLGFSTTFLSVGNSEALYGSHTLRGTGDTQRNDFGTSDTHRPLGAQALIDAIAKMNRFKGHNGVQLKRVKNLKLIVPVELIDEAHKIINSIYGPNNANLGLQQASADALKKRGMRIEAVEAADIPSTTYSTYWFLTSEERARERAFMAWGWKPRMTRDDKASEGVLREVGSTYFGPAVLGWQWTFASKGDSSTPS